MLFRSLFFLNQESYDFAYFLPMTNHVVISYVWTGLVSKRYLSPSIYNIMEFNLAPNWHVRCGFEPNKPWGRNVRDLGHLRPSPWVSRHEIDEDQVA